MYIPPVYNLKLFVLIFLALAPGRALAGPFLECPELLGPLPAPEALTDFEATVLCNDTLAILYNHDTRTPALVVEKLERVQTEGRADRKYSRFRPDPRLGERQAALSDYRMSGYDRGHMAPAANFKVDQAAMDQSFWLSNIAPQVGRGFNRSIWRNLEEWIRAGIRPGATLFIFTGPVFYDFTPVIGDNRVVVPDAFFKLVYDPESGESFAFLIANSPHPSGDFMPFLIAPEVLESKAKIRFNLVTLEAFLP